MYRKSVLRTIKRYFVWEVNENVQPLAARAYALGFVFGMIFKGLNEHR